MEPGTRVILALLRLVAEGVTAGDVTDGPALVPVPRPLRADLARVAADVGMDVDPAVMARAVLLWATLFGAVSLEVFGQYGEDTFKERGLLFEQQIRLALTVVRG
jgi:hypothetical protein